MFDLLLASGEFGSSTNAPGSSTNAPGSSTNAPEDSVGMADRMGMLRVMRVLRLIKLVAFRAQTARQWQAAAILGPAKAFSIDFSGGLLFA